MESNPLKKCRKCGEKKPKTKEFFHRQKDTGDGFANRCKDCVKEYQQARYGHGYLKRRRDKLKLDWARSMRRAQYQEQEEKVATFCRLLQRQGHQILERRVSVYGRTTLIRVLYRNGDVKTIYFLWKGNQFNRKESDGASQAEKAIKRRLEKTERRRQTGRDKDSRLVSKEQRDTSGRGGRDVSVQGTGA